MRVAVAVAADPGTEPHEGRHPCVGAARLRLRESGLDAAVEPRHGPEQRLVEDRQHGLHLVARLRLRAAQRRGALQDVDVLQEPAARDGLFGRAVERIVVAVELRGDPQQRAGDRPPTSLGGVRREHRVDAHPREPVAHVERVGDLLDRVADTAGVDAAGELAVLDPQRPRALPLLGEVRQVQVHGDGPGQPRGRLLVEGGDDLIGARAVLAVARLPAGRDERREHLDEIGVASLGEHLLVQRVEKRQVVGERPGGAGAGQLVVGVHGHRHDESLEGRLGGPAPPALQGRRPP